MCMQLRVTPVFFVNVRSFHQGLCGILVKLSIVKTVKNQRQKTQMIKVKVEV